MKIIRLIFAPLLLLFSNAVQYSSCERFNIVPSPDSPCPGEFTGEPCLTLQQYVANPSLRSNITFELHSGNHNLDSVLRVQNINSFTMRATTSATITCGQRLYQPFYFNRLQQVYVSGITFVGCRMAMRYISNATIERNSSFVDGNSYACCYSGRALYAYQSSVLIRQCKISNNRVYQGAIYGSQSTFVIEQTTFRMNHNPYTCCGTVYNGAAINFNSGYLDIYNSTFNSNSVSANSHGGAIYASSAVVNITGTHFSDNRAGRNGGAVYFDGSNISITNSSFINNRAIAGGGGAIYSARRYTNISLVDNIFNHNTAAYCGVMEVAEFYHYHVNIIGNTFIYNRAVQQISGNNAGGVICIRNASVLVTGNTFSHNSAAGDAGVIQVDESDIIINRSIFSNNRAGGNGGVLHTYFYPTTYTITDCSFINNRAGGDGGVMYIGRALSHMTINQGTFGFNYATNRGGVIAIIGSTLEMNGSSIFGNSAELGDAISACNSNTTIFNLDLLLNQDPTYSFCSLYNESGTTNITSANYTIAEIDDLTTPSPASQVHITNIVPTPDSLCPGEFTGEPCFTLEQYAVYPPSHSPNITLNLHPGTHHLNTRLYVSNIYSFTMHGNMSTTVIICREETYYSSFDFNQLQLIRVRGITFIGCSMNLGSIVNATVVKSSFLNRSRNGVALSSYDSSVWIEQCTMTNNRNGAFSFSGSNLLSLTIDQSLFSNNSNSFNTGYYYYPGYYYYGGGAIDIYSGYYNGMAVYPNGRVNIVNSIFKDNYGINFQGSNGGDGISISNCTFKNNTGISFSYPYIPHSVDIFNSTFKDNRARRSDHGGAIHFDGGNITIFNSKFINNTANGRGGGAIYFTSGRHVYSGNAIMLLVNNTFSHNTAAYCGVIKMTEFYHSDINITGNTFTFNRAIDLIPGNNGGGVICARNASISVVDNNFSHNSAAGDAGVIQADDSQITIERSIFSNNTAGGNGGALQTYLYPTNYMIVNSSFTNNQAGGDGGAMYIGRAGSHVTIYGSTFSDNYAAERGGVIAIIGSTLQLNRASVYENFARTGEVVNSCNSNVTIINPVVLATQNPIVSSLCAPYNDSVSPTTVTTSVVPTTDPWTQESNTIEDLEDISTTDDTTDTIVTTTIPQPTEENVTMTAATLPQPDDTTEGITMTTAPVPQPNDTTEDVTVMTTAASQPDDTTTDSVTMAKTTPHQPDRDDVTSKPAREDTRSTHTMESDSAETVVMTTSKVNIDDQDSQQDTAQNSLHTTVPVYAAIGVVFIVLVVLVVLVMVILVKVFKVKRPSLEPPKVNHLNFSTYEYPTMKNEFTLPEVHLVST